MELKFTDAYAAFLDAVPDPRMSGGNLRYPLSEMLLLCLSASICGLKDWTDIAVFGQSQLAWLRQYLPYKNGTPSHDCLGKTFAQIDNEAFSQAFTAWACTLRSDADQHLAIDGKCLRGSHDRTNGKAAIHLVNAFATQQGITLGQRKVDDKSNEITAIPALIEALVTKGCVVTIDAMGCQHDIAQQIIDAEANFVLAVKDNHPQLAEQAQQAFAAATVADRFEQTESDHGRVERRKTEIVTNLKWSPRIKEWAGAKAVARVQSHRYDKRTGKEQTEYRFYLCSLTSARIIHEAIRHHWHIENRLHWVLDVTFGEDESRKRDRQSAQNFSLVTKGALNLIRHHGKKGSIKGQRTKAAFDVKFREELMFT